MPISETEVKVCVTKACALVDGNTLSYLTVNIPSMRGSRSFQEHAKVMCGDEKSPAQIAEETWSHVDDALVSAANEGLSHQKIRLLFYRNGAPAGSRTFSTDLAPGQTEDDADVGTTGSLASALVATNKELRLALKDQLSIVERSAGEGWRLLQEQIRENAQLKAKLHETELALAITSGDEPDPMQAIGAKAAEAIIDVLKQKAVAQIASDNNNKPSEDKNGK